MQTQRLWIRTATRGASGAKWMNEKDSLPVVPRVVPLPRTVLHYSKNWGSEITTS